MVDIESLGSIPGSVVLSIGACKFDPEVGDVLDALLGLVRDLTLSMGHNSSCMQATTPCNCGKAKKMVAAHQRGVYVVRAFEAGKE